MGTNSYDAIGNRLIWTVSNGLCPCALFKH
jgi:hypothetical protein